MGATLKQNEGVEEKRILKNGLPLYSIKSPGLHGFCLCLYARTGALYESERDNGVSHFTEHIVFRGLNRLHDGKLYEMLDSCGLTFTAATYKEFMQFCITGASEHFSLAATLLSELFEPLPEALRGADFESERGRVRAEIREYDEKSSLEYLVKREAWGNTPLARMITGTLGSVSKITLKKCEEARKSMLSENNAFFYVTGCFSDADLEFLGKAVEKYAPTPATPRRNQTPLPCNFGKRSGTILLRDGAYYMVMLNFDVAVEAEQKPIRALLYDVMFAGENCLFFGELSEKRGYIYSYDAKIEEYGNAASLSISFEVSLKNLYDSLSAVVDLLNDVKKHVEPSALHNAKVYYTDNACLLLDNAEELNWTMAYENHILEERSDGLLRRRTRYEAVTEKDVVHMAREIFHGNNLIVGIKGRKKKLDLARIENILKQLEM